ncbi:MAG: 50S ribosomal protein L25/general stress protein Ctc [Rhodospirillales bacterium]|nr:50S ribosomal protein L25/general stress protein Ctc [Alphaproteobacteria bacterium]MCB9986148.1 50S ribosomal protein L25/general stress protein Ctc [Rhodospirillales bacterium]USO08625.1 MAG: 50S ribosomal protein L25/general stress protein Ctc [Rhodospirillales bacterium]
MTADKREGSGKGTARAVRRTNRIPAVIYGGNKEPVLISMDEKPLTYEYHRGHLFTVLCDLSVAGEKHLVIARDLQRDPVSDRIIHADFLRVTERTVISVDVPVHFEGQAENAAIKAGATLTVVNHEIPLMCPANAIPESITIDIGDEPVGHSFKLADIKLPQGAKPGVNDAASFTVATISAPRVEEVIAAEAPTAGEVPATNVAPDEAKDAKKDEKK